MPFERVYPHDPEHPLTDVEVSDDLGRSMDFIPSAWPSDPPLVGHALGVNVYENVNQPVDARSPKLGRGNFGNRSNRASRRVNDG